jgi:UDP-glucuronate 4-epimerase
MQDRILVTGAAGFIGFHVALRLLQQGRSVVGIDNLNDYYDVSLKYLRLKELEVFPEFTFVKADISDKAAMESLWAEKGPFREVVHLAAQAGVRHSLKNPYAYITSNCMGHLTVLEMCRHTPDFKHLVYASSSSVYGGNTKLPFSVQDPVDTPISLYAATKRSDELMSYAYSHLYTIPQTGLRFFTVYGPWGRPDMALFIFTKAIQEGRPVQLFNDGNMMRDFTYIDDITEGVIAALEKPPAQKKSEPPHVIYNLGNNRSENIQKYLAVIEKSLNKKAQIELLPLQAGDVEETYADISESAENLGFKPATTIEDGVPKFTAWYKKTYS